MNFVLVARMFAARPSRAYPLRPWALLPLLASLAALGACDPEQASLGEERRLEVAPTGQCAEGPRLKGARVNPRLGTIGPYANAMAHDGQYLYIAESGTNTVSRLHLASGRMDTGFVDVGNDRNPYDLFADPQARRLYIANFASDSLTVADLATGQVIAEILAGEEGHFQNPQGIARIGNWLYVSNVAYLGRSKGYGQGFVTVVDPETLAVLGTLPTAFQNPQHLLAVSGAQGDELLVASSGELSFTYEGVSTRGEGGLEIWRPTVAPLLPERQAFPIGQLPLPRQGAPGQPVATPDGRHIYLPSAIAPILFKFDRREQRWIHDAQNPLPLYEAQGDTTHAAAIDPEGMLYITAFNNDALYVLDTRCDALVAGPIPLGTGTAVLEGPMALTLAPISPAAGRQTAPQLYYLLSNANALGRIALDFD